MLQKKRTFCYYQRHGWNQEECDIPNFNCITHFKRDFVRSGGVVIYQNTNDTTNLVTPNMSIIMNNIQDLHVRRTSVADLCNGKRRYLNHGSHKCLTK